MTPGKELANALGYELFARYGDGAASYLNSNLSINLTIKTNGTAELCSVHRMVSLTIGPFQWPHPKFHSLQAQINLAAIAVRGAI